MNLVVMQLDGTMLEVHREASGECCGGDPYIRAWETFTPVSVTGILVYKVRLLQWGYRRRLVVFRDYCRDFCGFIINYELKFVGRVNAGGIISDY